MLNSKEVEKMELKEVDAIIDRWRNTPGELLSILEEVQEKEGYLPKEILRYISKKLDIPLSRIFSVATFFAAFSLKPRGRHTIQVCLGTACHVRGAPKVLNELKHTLQIDVNDTTEDRKFTLTTVRCLGCCALGPVVRIDSDTHIRVTPRKIKSILSKYN